MDDTKETVQEDLEREYSQERVASHKGLKVGTLGGLRPLWPAGALLQWESK